MVRKEDLCDWFKALPPHKRVDFMCDLLRLCLPLELRFLGTVLEDLAKKDFHVLRDQEIKANQRMDLLNNSSNGLLSDKKLRAKIVTALALLNSTNSACANIIYDLLQQEFPGVLRLLSNAHSAADLLMILTMAVHHPAFSFFQRSQLSQVLDRVEEYLQDLWDEEEDESDLILQRQAPAAPYNSTLTRLTSTDRVVKVRVMDVELHSNSRDNMSYKCHVSWTSGAVTEVSLRYRQLLDLHSTITRRFPELKKIQIMSLVFPERYTEKGDALSEHKDLMNIYFSQLSKAPPHILTSEVLSEPFKNGTILLQPKASTSTALSPVASISTSQLQSHVYYSRLWQEDLKQEVPQYNQRINHGVRPGSSSEPSQVSSITNSPVSSRTSSPAPLTPSSDGRTSRTAICSDKGGMLSGDCGAVSSNYGTEQTLQLLRVLNLEEYMDRLKDYPVNQIYQMSKEDLARAGLPPEAQVKLRTKFSQIRPSEVNGMVEPSEPLPAVYPIYLVSSPTLMSQPLLPHSSLSLSPYSSLPSHLPSSPQLPPHPCDSSPASSDTSSPPLSHIVPSTNPNLSLDRGNMVVEPPASLRLMSLPVMPADSLAGAERRLLNGVKYEHVHSSGSEDERLPGFGQKLGSSKKKAGGKRGQTQSLPSYSQGSVTHSSLETNKLSGMLIPMSAPHMYPGLKTPGETRLDGTPPLLQTMKMSTMPMGPGHLQMNPINGHLPDSSSGMASKVHGSRGPLLNGRALKSDQSMNPSGLGIPGNMVSVPAPEMAHPLHGSGSGAAAATTLPTYPGGLHFPSYSLPLASPVHSSHVIGLNQVNFQGGHLPHVCLQPPPTPSMVADGTQYHRYILSPHPRILTTIANTTAMVITSQSHHTPPTLYHSSSPATTTSTISLESLHSAPYLVGVAESNRLDDLSLTSNVLDAATKSNKNASSASSGNNTPSPPLAPAQKQIAPQLYGFPNGLVPPLFCPQQNPQHHLPNGLTSDFNSFLRLQPHITPSHFSVLYGSMQSPHNMTGNAHAPSASSNIPSTLAPCQSGKDSSSRKSGCYNCGLADHDAATCVESHMETISNTFRLKYNPPSDSPI